MSSSSWKIVVAGAVIIAGAGVGMTIAHAASDHMPPFMHHRGAGMGPGVMGPGMMGMGPMGMAQDDATMAQLGTIHELFLNHDRIERTVTNLPDGIRTMTESDDPRIAQLIKEHVAEMGARVGEGDDPGLPIESDALHSIFRNYDKVETTVAETDKGVVVTQTSDDRDTVAALQQHASEVSDFVTEGMVAMHTAMMKKMGGGIPAGMHPGMFMRHGPALPRDSE
jgi:hypothetical protein